MYDKSIVAIDVRNMRHFLLSECPDTYSALVDAECTHSELSMLYIAAQSFNIAAIVASDEGKVSCEMQLKRIANALLNLRAWLILLFRDDLTPIKP